MTGALRQFVVELEEALALRDRGHQLRQPRLREGVDLTSNDYLGLADEPDLKACIAAAVGAWGAGAGGSRLLAGHHRLYDEVEAALAELTGRPALLFSSGYAANIGILPALAGRDDTILSDALNHASLIDGVRLSRAERAIYAHQDLDELEALLRRPTRGRRFIVTESLFSMDGDQTDLKAICDLADRHDALVIVDEAHATGLFGERGAGLVQAQGLTERVLLTMHTGGKALGVGGAWVSGPRPVITHLINHARSFVYSTAPVPALAAGLLHSVGLLARSRHRVDAVHAKAARLRGRLLAGGVDLRGSESYIIPIVVGPCADALKLAAALREDGFGVRAVRPPTVPEGTARLRVTVRANLADADLDRFAQRLLAHRRAL